jgi:hypothetical protein
MEDYQSSDSGQTRRSFIRKAGAIVGCSGLIPDLLASQTDTGRRLKITTTFPGGGGTTELISRSPVTIRFTPHNEGGRGWGQMWFYFLIDGLKAGEEIDLQLDLGSPRLPGINPEIVFSYDQRDWGRSERGRLVTISDKEYFVYRLRCTRAKVWLAYEMPYMPDLIENTLLKLSKRSPKTEIFELCKTRNGRRVEGFRLSPLASGQPRYGIWLQARAHAFENGTSWVLHEFLLWLFSSEKQAIALRQNTEITVLPLIDVDAVEEGRTGKNQKPYDHNRGWNHDPAHWPEVNSIKSLLKKKSEDQMLDLFIDLHGPGNETHPYFIVPVSKDLPHEFQQKNRKSFFDILGVEALPGAGNPAQTMDRFHVSERPLDKVAPDCAATWVTMNLNASVISLTLEVNMNTPLSTREGYKQEAIKLGKAMTTYFGNRLHAK